MFKKIIHRILSFLFKISERFEDLIRQPFRQPARQNESKFGWLVGMVGKFFMFLFGLFGTTLLFPFHLFTVVSMQRRREFLYGLPALAIFSLIVLTVSRSLLQGRAITEKYRSKAAAALQDNDNESAKTYLGRVLRSGYETNGDKFNWAISLLQSGELNRGLAIMDQLAPDTTRNFDLAHRFKALQIAEKEDRIDSSETAKLKFHLQAANDTPGLDKAWSVYYLAVDQKQDAVKHLELAAQSDPQLFVSVAELYRQLDNSTNYQQTLNQAKRLLEPLLRQQPESNKLRIALANIENRLENFHVAETLLVRGLKIQDDMNLRSALASFYVNQHDLTAKTDGNLETRIKHIQSALKYGPNHTPAYDRLVSIFQNIESPIQRIKLRSQLEETITSGRSPALAHFALSNILWIDGDSEQAQWHMEQAFRHEPGFSNVVNNLAWLLAHQNPPDLKRGLELIEGVVQKFPADVRFRDTLGTILMKLDKLDQAAVELEKCLAGQQPKPETHKKLAYIYGKLGRQNLARLHQRALAQPDTTTR